MPSTFTRIITLLGCSILLAACGDPSLEKYQVASRGVHDASISDDGRFVLIGSILHGGSLWNHTEQARLFNWNHTKEEASTFTATAFSPEGKWALSAETHNMVLWDTQSGQGARFWTAPGEVLDADLSSNGNYALLGLSDHSAVLFNVKEGGILRTFQHENRVRSVDLSNDGRYALTGSEDYRAILWDLDSGESKIEIKHDDDVQLVKLSPDGSLALSMSKYDKALVWKTENGEALGEILLSAQRLKRGALFTSAVFSEDNQWLLTGRQNQQVELWNLAKMSLEKRWKLTQRYAWKPTRGAIVAAHLSPDSKITIVASDGYVHTLEAP